jgi:hypothetical protein
MSRNAFRARVGRALVVTIAAGAAIAANAQQTTPPRWRGTVDLTIGGENGTDDATFGSISGITTDAAGRVFVADRQDNQIRVFSPTGALVEKLGRAGSGPLEFKRLATITIGPDGLLWARDEGNSRMLAFNVSKTPFTNARTVPLRNLTGGSRVPPVFETAGIMVDESITFDKKLDAFRPIRQRINSSGEVLRSDTIPVPADAFVGIYKFTKTDKNSIASYTIPQPYGPRWLKAYGPGGLRAEAMSSRYDVKVYGADGRLVRTLQRTVAPIALSPREAKAGEKQLSERLEIQKLARSAVPFGVPSVKSPLEELCWTLDGNLWVQRAVPDGRPSEADVYDANGKWIAVAEWPSRLDIMNRSVVPAIRGRTMFGITRDSSDVESVVRVRFR